LEERRKNRNQNSGSRLRIQNLTQNTEIASCAEVADTASARNKGLLGRSSLPDGGGLWITPCESVHTFFMKFPIDLVYIDRNKVVKKVRNRVGPWRLSACFSAHSILELPAGAAERSQTRCGDQIQISPAVPEAVDATPGMVTLE
jgi:uncharacterized membrane protein (UPF0127 family)